MIDIHSKYDYMHTNGIFYVLICISNNIISCEHYMLSMTRNIHMSSCVILPSICPPSRAREWQGERGEWCIIFPPVTERMQACTWEKEWERLVRRIMEMRHRRKKKKNRKNEEEEGNDGRRKRRRDMCDRTFPLCKRTWGNYGEKRKRKSKGISTSSPLHAQGSDGERKWRGRMKEKPKRGKRAHGWEGGERKEILSSSHLSSPSHAREVKRERAPPSLLFYFSFFIYLLILFL